MRRTAGPGGMAGPPRIEPARSGFLGGGDGGGSGGGYGGHGGGGGGVAAAQPGWSWAASRFPVLAGPLLGKARRHVLEGSRVRQQFGFARCSAQDADGLVRPGEAVLVRVGDPFAQASAGGARPGAELLAESCARCVGEVFICNSYACLGQIGVYKGKPGIERNFGGCEAVIPTTKTANLRSTSYATYVAI